MAGSAGSDADQIENLGDAVLKAVGPGFDAALVFVDGSTQAAGIEGSLLTDAARRLTGSDGADLVTAHQSAAAGSTLNGALGDDTLNGDAAADVLLGGGGTTR